MEMNILLQWLRENIDIMAIGISLISLFLSVISFVRFSSNTQKEQKWYRLKKIWAARHRAFHILVLSCLTIYITVNWEKCITMQFVSQFNGNNILFLAWLVLIFLIIYEVEGKGVKVAQRKQEETQKSLGEAGLKYQVDAMLEQLENGNLNGNIHQEEGEGSNELSN